MHVNVSLVSAYLNPKRQLCINDLLTLFIGTQRERIVMKNQKQEIEKTKISVVLSGFEVICFFFLVFRARVFCFDLVDGIQFVLSNISFGLNLQQMEMQTVTFQYKLFGIGVVFFFLPLFSSCRIVPEMPKPKTDCYHTPKHISPETKI